MTEPRKPGPGAIGDIHTDPTQPAVRAVNDPLISRPRAVTNVEVLDAVVSMRREISGELGDVKREMRDIRDEQRSHRDEINELKRSRVPRPKLESLTDIEDGEVVSGSVLRQAMRRQSEHAAAATSEQTALIQAQAKALLWKPVLATVSTIALALIAQFFAARGTISSEVRESTKEAVRESAPAVAKEAAEAVKETVQTAPKGTP